jgi:AraC-like DNA-binding protein
MRRRINRQQQRLALKIEELKQDLEPFGESLASLSALTAAMRAPSRQKVMAALDEFLGHILLTAENNLEKAKSAVVVLLGILLWDTMESGGAWPSLLKAHEQQLNDLKTIVDIEALCFWVEDLVLKQHTTLAPRAAAQRGEKLIDQALSWMRRTYNTSVGLADAAEALGTSESTISHRLKQETGKTFGQHLRGIRISEAKRLLAYTSLPVGEIGRRCGFADQSYFTKVFRRQINLSPREFRDMLTNPADQS